MLNVIRTQDASTENAFAAKVIKEMASPVRKVSVEMMAGDHSAMGPLKSERTVSTLITF